MSLPQPTDNFFILPYFVLRKNFNKVWIGFLVQNGSLEGFGLKKITLYITLFLVEIKNHVSASKIFFHRFDTPHKWNRKFVMTQSVIKTEWNRSITYNTYFWE